MQTIKMILMAALTALFLSSCGADSKEKICDDALAAMEEMLTILEPVKDKASAEKAKPALEALVAKMKKVESRLEALGLTTEDMEKEMKENEKYKTKMTELKKKLMGPIMKLALNKEVGSVLGDTMKKIK